MGSSSHGEVGGQGDDVVLLQARRPIGRHVRLLASRFPEERRSLLTHLAGGGSPPLRPFEIDTTGGAVG